MGSKAGHDFLVTIIAQITGNNAIHLAPLQGFLNLIRSAIHFGSIAKSLQLGKASQICIAGIAYDGTQNHAIKALVVAVMIALVILLHGNNGHAFANGLRKSKFLKPLLILRGRSYHINFAPAQHVQHILPRFIVAYKFVIQVGVTTQQKEEVTAIASAGVKSTCTLLL